MKLPVLSGRELIRVLAKAGYWVHDQRGSHVHLRHTLRPPLTIPNHDEVAIGTLKAIIKGAGFSEEDFMELMK